MRSLCNVAFTIRCRAFDDDAELRAFEHNLALPPGARERKPSKGTQGLMQAMGMQKAGG